jgi:8-oxo-dGTP diphosphatase
MKKYVMVVAAVIENEIGEILCAFRSLSMSMPNMWEFPDG